MLENIHVTQSQLGRHVLLVPYSLINGSEYVKDLECVSYLTVAQTVPWQAIIHNPIVAGITHSPSPPIPQHLYFVHLLGLTSSIQMSRLFWNPHKQTPTHTNHDCGHSTATSPHGETTANLTRLSFTKPIEPKWGRHTQNTTNYFSKACTTNLAPTSIRHTQMPNMPILNVQNANWAQTQLHVANRVPRQSDIPSKHHANFSFSCLLGGP